MILLGTCGLDQLTSSSKVISVQLSKDTVMVVGTGASFWADTGNGYLAAGVRIGWSSSNPGVAKVVVDTVAADSMAGACIVWALSEGSAAITATVTGPELPPNGITASRTVVVGYKGISIAPVDSLTGLGQVVTPIVSGEDVNGTAVAVVTAPLTSSDPTIVAVAGGASNTLVAKKNGTATITATHSGLTATTAVKVRQVAKRVVFGANPFVFKSLGRDTTVGIQVFDTNDSLVASPVLAWSSLNTAVATVTAAGLMRALQVAATTIRVTSDTVTASLPVSVSQAPATLSKSTGDRQSQTVGLAVGVAPTVSVKDAGGYGIAGVQVTFSVAMGGGSITGASQTTDGNGNAAVGSWTLGTVQGPNTLVATAGSLSATFVAGGMAGAPASLGIIGGPSGSNAVGTALTPALQVAIFDTYGNAVTTATNAVTVALAANPGSATLGGTRTVNADSGLATFSDLTVSVPGTGYTLTATAAGLTSATTWLFNVYGPPAKLAFSTQPSAVVAGAAITPAVQVTVEDASGQALTSATNSVTIAIGTNSGSGTLSGTATQAAVGGVATFSALSINKAGTGYTLTASATGLTGATSSAFNVTAGTAAKLAFLVQPSNTPPSTAINPPVQVAIQDALGNTVTSAATSVTLAIGINPASGALTGGSATAASSGVATFSSLKINNSGNGYTLVASATGLASATSSAFNILAPGTPKQLVFVTQPSATIVGLAINPSVTVKVVDSIGTTVTSSSASITIGVGTNPGSAILGGTLTVNASGGVATFSNLRLSAAGNGYTLVATSSALNPDTSAVFNVAAFGAASKLAFLVQPSNANVNTVISPALQVAVQDAQGNTLTSSAASVTLSFGANPGSATLGGTLTQAAVSGVATFSDLTLGAAGTGYTLAATSGGLSSATSATFNIVNPGAATKLGFLQQPTGTTTGSVIVPGVTVAIQNGSGGTVTSDNSTVVSMTVASGPGPLRGALSATAVNGVATFSTLSDTVAGTYTLLATASGLTSATSASYTISAGVATKLLFIAQPTSATAGEPFNPVVRVAVADVYGNTVPSATNSVTIDIGGGACDGTSDQLNYDSFNGTCYYPTSNLLVPAIGGTLTVVAVNGVASFPGLRPRLINLWSLVATATGLTSGYSQILTVTPSAPYAVWVALPGGRSPTQQTANAGFAVSAYILDSLNNQVNAGSNVISLGIGSNPGAGTLSTANNIAATNGRADFNVSISKGGNGYTLVGSTAGLSSLASFAFNVAAYGTATRLGFVVQPSQTAVGAAISPAVQVCVQDAVGNTVTTATNSIVVAIGTNPGSATLGGTLTANATSGCATFSNLTLSAAGSGYTLTAGTSGLTSATSSAFNVTP